jgi:hypothetical protein
LPGNPDALRLSIMMFDIFPVFGDAPMTAMEPGLKIASRFLLLEVKPPLLKR